MSDQYRQIYRKISIKQPLKEEEWFVLHELCKRKFLFGKKKKLRNEMAKQLFSMDDNAMNDEMKFLKSLVRNMNNRESIENKIKISTTFAKTALKESIFLWAVLLATITYCLLATSITRPVSLICRIVLFATFVLQCLISFIYYKWNNQRAISQGKEIVFLPGQVTAQTLAYVWIFLAVTTMNHWIDALTTRYLVQFFLVWLIAPIGVLGEVIFEFIEYKCRMQTIYCIYGPEIRHIKDTEWEQLILDMDKQEETDCFNINNLPLLKCVMYELLRSKYDWQVGFNENIPDAVYGHKVFRYYHTLAQKAFDKSQTSAREHFDTLCKTSRKEN